MYLKVKPKPEISRKSLQYWIRQKFLRTQKTQTTKEKKNEADFIKIKNICSPKTMFEECKVNHRPRENVCKVHIKKKKAKNKKPLISRIYRKFSQLHWQLGLSSRNWNLAGFLGWTRHGGNRLPAKESCKALQESWLLGRHRGRKPASSVPPCGTRSNSDIMWQREANATVYQRASCTLGWGRCP